MTKHLNGEQRAADRPNHGVDGVPDRIDPRNFVGEKFEEIENAGDGDDPGIAEDFERLVLWRQRDPVKMNGEPGDKNGQVKIDAGERSETERDGEQIELFHGGNIRRSVRRLKSYNVTNDRDAFQTLYIICNVFNFA